MTVPHYNVIIATPGYEMDSAYVISLINTVKVLESHGITWAYTSRSCSDVSIAREWTILAKAVDSIGGLYEKPLSGNATYDKLFMIDSDIYWEPNDFLKMYESELDLISGVYLQSNGMATTIYDNNKRIMEYSEMLNKFDVFEAYASGLGFMCVKSGVFEKLERPWFSHKDTKINVNDNEFLVEMFSEDISFIKKAKESGFKLYVDPLVKVGHVKKMNLSW